MESLRLRVLLLLPGTALGVSSFASRTIEELAAANDKLLFQIYWMGGRERVEQILERARAAGAKALILTLDWSFAHRRDWGSPTLPPDARLRSLARFAPAAIARPRWLLQYLRSGGMPSLTAPNMARPREPAPAFFDAYGEWMATPPPTWDDIAWLSEKWGGPLLVKGVAHPEDARAAVQAGASAISVSNHGGNNLDGTPASIRLLPGVADAVSGELEIVLDGGIRRGADVVRAVALGAQVVMIGRASLWGLAAGGEAGVSNVLGILRDGIRETLMALAVDDVHDLARHHILVPDGFSPALR